MTASGGRVRLIGRRRRAGNGIPVWFGLAFAGAGIIAMVAAVLGYRNATRLIDEGVATQGTVVQLYTTPTDSSRDEYWVAYTFTDPASGRAYRDSAQVDWTTYESAKVGDPIRVTYLPSDPGSNTAGTPTANPLLLVLVEGIGLLFVVTGGVLAWSTIRKRRAPKPTPAATASAPSGATAPVDVARARVDVFSRSRGQVVLQALSPLIGLAAIAFGVYAWTHVSLPDGLFFGGLGAVLGTLFVLIGIRSIRNGLGRRMLEVGPDGLWLRGLGWLPWSDVGEVRLEEAHPVGAASVADGGGGDGLAPETVTRAVTPTYEGIAIVPRDPMLASPGAPGTLVAAIGGSIASLQPGVRRSESASPARYRLRPFEVDVPFEEVVASLRRFAPMAPVTAAGSAPALPSPETMLAPSLVEVSHDGNAVPASARYWRRRGSLLGGGQVQIEGGGIGSALLTAAIGTVADAVRGDEPGPEVLEVGPGGLSIPDVVDLAWDDIAAIDVEERTFNERPDNILRVVPANAALTEARRPPRGSPWSVDRLGGSRLRCGGSAAYVIHLKAIDANADDVLDVIAQYHVIDEGP